MTTLKKLLFSTLLTISFVGSAVAMDLPADHAAMADAIIDDNVDGVRALLEAGVSANSSLSAGATPLLFAVSEASPEVTRLLLAHGAHVNATDERNANALSYAASRRGEEGLQIVALLLRAGASTNNEDVGGWTPLGRAIVTNRPDMVELILAQRPTALENDIDFIDDPNIGEEVRSVLQRYDGFVEEEEERE